MKLTRQIIKLIFFTGVAFGFVNCTKTEPNEPIPQEILFSDTSGYTGELTVHVFYNDGFGTYPAINSIVFLYAAYDDIIRDLDNYSEDLAIYRLITADDKSAYFGFINNANYYVFAYNTIQGIYYDKISIVQVRAQQHETLNITLEHID